MIDQLEAARQAMHAKLLAEEAYQNIHLKPAVCSVCGKQADQLATFADGKPRDGRIHWTITKTAMYCAEHCPPTGCTQVVMLERP